MKTHAWAKLLCFPYGGLSVSRQEEDGPSLTSKIRSAINAYRDTSVLSSLPEPSCAPSIGRNGGGKKRNNPSAHKKLVDCKMADMDVRGAIRVLSSTEDFAEDDADTHAALSSKHPPAPPDTSIPDAPAAPDRYYTEAEVIASLRSFPLAALLRALTVSDRPIS